MKKIIVLLVALLLNYSYNVYATETIHISEEYEVITVFHDRTGKMLFTDTLTNHRIIYTEKGVNDYAFNNIPSNFFDTSEKYIINNKYFNGGEKTHEDKYMIYFDCWMGHPESSFSQWKYKRIY